MKYRLFLLTILASVGFFNPFQAVSDQMQKLIFYICILACLLVGLLEGVSLQNVKYPRKAYAVLLASIAFSCIMATAFHMQTLTVSIMTVLPVVFAYSFFYALMKMDVPEEKIMNTYLVLCAISMVVYFANVLTFPNNIFGPPILNEDTSRGIIRIPVVFIEFFPMMVFYAINQYLLTRRKCWFWVVAFAFLMIVLSVIRQIIVLTAVLSLFFYFRNVSWKIKAALAVAVVAVVFVVLPMIPMYQAMVELSEDQKEQNEEVENIRITAWRYYTFENQTNSITPLFGNGIPSFGNSRWGIEFDSETEDNGCFAADVGWAGFYWYFGIFALVALAIMEIKGILRKKDEKHQYLTYWLVFLFITSFASGPPLYYWQILDIMVCFYLVFSKCPEKESVAVADVLPIDENSSKVEETSNKAPQPGMPALPVGPRYPQIEKR